MNPRQLLTEKPAVAGQRCARLAIALVLLAIGTLAMRVAPSSVDAVSPDTAVLDWNRYAVEAFVNAPTAATPGAGQTPPVSVLHVAMVQGAIYDAVNMIDGRHTPYIPGLPAAPASASKQAAIATAAHHVLVAVEITPPFSASIIDRLNGLYEDAIAEAITEDGADAVAEGIAAGEAAAEAMLELREDDGRYGPFRFELPGDDPGDWQLTPPALVNDPFAWVARVTPFVLESTSQFRTKGPHALNTGIYAKEYKEVLELGGNGTTTPTLRTPEQTALAQFYTANPIELYNRAFRELAENRGLTLAEQARLFAMLNMAGADALINCWDDKAHWLFWRPITAIREGDDPNWTPLVPTPPYPDHPSGYNCVTAAFMHAAVAFFGSNNIPFALTQIGTPNTTRVYNRFTKVIADTIDARIYLGIHFRAPDVQGAELGRDVARWLDKHYFRPVK